MRLERCGQGADKRHTAPAATRTGGLLSQRRRRSSELRPVEDDLKSSEGSR
jgi:hypothetical protein